MPSNKAFHRRIQILDQCLRRRQRVWTVTALLQATNEHLEGNGCPPISIRTLYDDLKYLQETLDAPVEKFHQGKTVCYRYSDPGYTLVNTPLTDEEKNLLISMLNYMRTNGLPFQEEIEALIIRHSADMLPNSKHYFRVRKFEQSSELSDAAPAPVSKSMSYQSQREADPLHRILLILQEEQRSHLQPIFWDWLDNGYKNT